VLRATRNENKRIFANQQRQTGLSTVGTAHLLAARCLGWICYLSTLRNRILHVTTAKTKIKRNGKRLSHLKTLSVISLYPHVAGNSFPIVSNVFGSSSIGNIIPESMVEGIKIMIENIEVFAWSFTAKPIILAILRDTPIKTARLIKYLPGFSGISA
jgi:hypothetical protein